MKLIKHILFNNFWSFLFILSGIVDIVLGVVMMTTGWLQTEDAPFPVFIICFIVGLIYLALGFLIAFIKMRKEKD